MLSRLVFSGKGSPVCLNQSAVRRNGRRGNLEYSSKKFSVKSYYSPGYALICRFAVRFGTMSHLYDSALTRDRTILDRHGLHGKIVCRCTQGCLNSPGPATLLDLTVVDHVAGLPL